MNADIAKVSRHSGAAPRWFGVEPGIQPFAGMPKSWIPGSIADSAGDGPGMTEFEDPAIPRDSR
jgi:hypothetical protein